jgi:hypothetical protein
MDKSINIALFVVLIMLSIALIMTYTRNYDTRVPIMSSADAAYVSAYLRKIKAGNCNIYQYGYGWQCEALDGSGLIYEIPSNKLEI